MLPNLFDTMEDFGDLKYLDEHFRLLGKEIPIFERLRHRMLWLSEWRRMMATYDNN